MRNLERPGEVAARQRIGETHYFSRFLMFFRRASGQGESPLILY
jgi:hypothetical protein